MFCETKNLQLKMLLIIKLIDQTGGVKKKNSPHRGVNRQGGTRRPKSQLHPKSQPHQPAVAQPRSGQSTGSGRFTLNKDWRKNPWEAGIRKQQSIFELSLLLAKKKREAEAAEIAAGKAAASRSQRVDGGQQQSPGRGRRGRLP